MTANKIVFKENFTILLSEIIKDLSNNYANAYVAIDNSGNHKLIYALICNRNALPRLGDAKDLLLFKHPMINTLLTFGYMNIYDDFDSFILIYNKPLGGKFLTTNKFDQFRRDKRTTKFLLQTAQLISALQSLGIYHGNINIDNLYWQDEEQTQLCFGDFLGDIYSINIDPLYETISMMQCHRFAKSSVKICHDIYAFGMLFFILIGGKKIKPIEVNKLIKLKIQNTSYGAIDNFVPANRITKNAFFIFLRNCLVDSDALIWSIDELLDWLVNKKIQTIRAMENLETILSSVVFDGKQYTNIRLLAHDMFLKWDLALEFFIAPAFLDWLNENRNYIEIDDIYEQANNSKTKRLDENVSLAQLLMLMDKQAPVRYKKLALFYPSIHNAIIYCLINKKSYAGLLQLWSTQLFEYWLNVNANNKAYESDYNNLLEYKHIALADNGYFSGLPKYIYMANDHIHCLSPLLLDFVVTDISGLLKIIAKRINIFIKADLLLDYYIVAFLYARTNLISNTIFNLYTGGGLMNKYCAEVLIFHNIFMKYKNFDYKVISKIFFKHIDFILQKINNKNSRKSMLDKAINSCRNGDLDTVSKILFDSEMERKDYEAFLWARSEYIANVNILNHVDDSQEKRLVLISKQIVSIISIASILLSLFIVFFL